jgi:imidazolonepropionase-like amidohydrolase
MSAPTLTPASIQRSIAAGVKCIEHGHLRDDETAKLMAEKGIWLSTQPFLDEEGEGGAQQLGPAAQAKMEQVIEGTDNVYRLAKKYHLKTAFGTDILFSTREAEQQGNPLGRAHSLVHARRSADHGDIKKRQIACSVRSSQSLPRQARRS